MGELEDAYFPTAGPVEALEPPEGISESEWLEWAGDDEGELEGQPQLEGPPPDERLLEPDEWQFDFEQRSQAVAEVEAEANQAGRLSYIEGRAKELGLTDPEAFARIDQQIVEAQNYWYRQYMAAGYTEAQAREEVASLDYDHAIDVGLGEERKRAFMHSDPSLRGWHAGREAQASKAVREGAPAPLDFTASPSWQRRNAASQRYLERVERREAEQAAVNDRQVYKRWWA